MHKKTDLSYTSSKPLLPNAAELYRHSAELYAKEAELHRRSAELYAKEAEIHQRSSQLYAKEADIYAKSANPKAVIEDIRAKIETIHELEQRIQCLRHAAHQVQLMEATISWKITAPLRVLRNLPVFLWAKGLLHGSLLTKEEKSARKPRRSKYTKSKMSKKSTVVPVLLQ